MVSYRRYIAALPAVVRSTAAAATGGAPKSGIVFHHIPKCAGTSIAVGLKQLYLPWQYKAIPAQATVEAISVLDHGRARGEAFDISNDGWDSVQELRQRMLFLYLCQGYRCVAGHVLYNERIHEVFSSTHRFVTILRDPVSRFISQFYYSRRSRGYDRVDIEFTETGLAAFGPAWGSTMTQFLAGGMGPGKDQSSTDAMVARAKRAVDRMDIIGFLDDMPAFTAAIAEKAGAKLQIPVRNRGSYDSREHDHADMLPLIRQFCAPDLEVYAYAKARANGAAAIPQAPS